MSTMAASQASVTFDTPKSVKALAAELPSHDNSINPIYAFQETPNIVNDEAISAEDGTLPTIDFSLLISTNPEERSKAIQDLGRACQDWGFFMLINHGVPESLFKAIMNGSAEFFDLPEEEKMQFKGKGILDPINYGSLRVGNVSFWRDFLKVFLHPQFHSINKPPGFRYGNKSCLLEYCGVNWREGILLIAQKICNGVWETGLLFYALNYIFQNYERIYCL
ncbi:hypothetical protein CCACVL1_10371 [Corchorus capsularis]|uniref:Non-haem dioxygenase N-terminal domain-containing protein n=1 Tax=Corchorus capsularis TaxID=210143 RepID=A0A1R3IRH9_COCAP|nr:hypothetical protein CCACVL1_10371 [Corchorus capsularis]